MNVNVQEYGMSTSRSRWDETFFSWHTCPFIFLIRASRVCLVCYVGSELTAGLVLPRLIARTENRNTAGAQLTAFRVFDGIAESVKQETDEHYSFAHNPAFDRPVRPEHKHLTEKDSSIRLPQSKAANGKLVIQLNDPFGELRFRRDCGLKRQSGK